MRMNNKGQALVEYILIILVVSLVLVSAVKMFGGILKDKMTESTCDLLGQTYVPGEKSGDGECK